MANRYWVGGTGSWSPSLTTNWSATSGGAGGASAPTSVDDVFFDANSNTGTNPFTVTITTNAVCRNWTVSGLDGVMTIAGTVNTFSVYGSISLQATNISVTFSGAIRLRASSGSVFITTNGNPLPSLRVECSGATTFLGSTLTLNGNVYPNIELISGIFNLNTYNLNLTGTSVNNINGSGSTSRTLILGSSTVNCYSASNPINLSGSNYGISASSSTINIFGNTASITESLSAAYGTVYFQSPTAIGTRSLATSSSFNTLRVDTGSVVGIYPFTVSSNITVGTLQLVSVSDPAYRHNFSSNVAGTARTLSSTTSYFLQNVDFRDITSASAVWSGTSIATLSNTTNIIASAAKTVYWNLAGTQNWSATGWATSSGGAPAVANFPLAQDTVIFDDNGAAGTITVNANYNLGTLNTSARTTAVTINISGFLYLFGSLLLGSGLTFSGILVFQGANTSSITSNGNTIGLSQIRCEKNAGVTLQLLDNFSSSVASFLVTTGTFLTNNYNFSVSSLSASGSGTKTLSFGSSTITISGSGNSCDLTGSNTTFSSNTATLSFSSASSKNFRSVTGFGFGSLIQNGAGALSMFGVVCTNISTNVLPTTVNFYGTNTFTNFNLNGTPGNLVTLGNANATFSNVYSLRAVIVTTSPSTLKTLNYVDVSGLQFESPSGGVNTVSWYATNSTNSGNNQGIFFSDTSKKILYILTGTSFVLPNDWNPNNNRIFLVGGGGSGGQSFNTASGGGGGGGGFTLVQNYAAPPGATVSYNVGAPGYYSNGGNTTWSSSGYTSHTANGGGAAPYTTFPYNAGGTGGVGSTFNGGNGGNGIAAVGSSSFSLGGGGGGGSGGPLGNGAVGGNGFQSGVSQTTGAGGGGGGNGGGSAGQNGTSATGGAGGNNASGLGGGAASNFYTNPGSAGGGGSGNTGNSFSGYLIPSTGSDIAGSFGTGGGAGGAGWTQGNMAYYDFFNSANGAGGGGGGWYFGSTYIPGYGGSGIIVVEYTPTTDFLMFMNAR